MKGKSGLIIGILSLLISTGIGLADLMIKNKKGIKLDEKDKNDIADKIVRKLKTEDNMI